MYPSTSSDRYRKPALVVLLLLCILLLGQTVAAFQTAQKTGLVKVKTSDAKAIISVTQSNHGAAVVGTGNTNIRLRPGTYLLAAGTSGHGANQVVVVQAKRTTSVFLKLGSAAGLPSPDNIDLAGTDTLLNNGVSSTQITKLRQLLFNYKGSIQQVTVDPESVRFVPHDPNSGNTNFTMNFTGAIDGSKYRATLTYADLDNIQLRLFNPSTNTLLYSGDSATVINSD